VTGTPALGPVSQTPQWKLVPLALLGDWKTATAVKVSAAVVKKLANDRVFIIYTPKFCVSYSVVRSDRCKINSAFFILIAYQKKANVLSKVYINFTLFFLIYF
jgi:hypothetical protein